LAKVVQKNINQNDLPLNTIRKPLLDTIYSDLHFNFVEFFIQVLFLCFYQINLLFFWFIYILCSLINKYLLFYNIILALNCILLHVVWSVFACLCVCFDLIWHYFACYMLLNVICCIKLFYN
jgi:hypothetical protein